MGRCFYATFKADRTKYSGCGRHHHHAFETPPLSIYLLPSTWGPSDALWTLGSDDMGGVLI